MATNPLKRVIVIAIILLCCIGCDQATKQIARQSLPRFQVIRLFHDTIRLQYTENRGGFLSLGAGIPEMARYWIFTILVGLFLAGLFIFLVITKRLGNQQFLALSLVLAGGLSNWLDRILHGGWVVDFLNLGLGNLRTGVFNVADLAIMLGVIWLAGAALRDSLHHRRS